MAPDITFYDICWLKKGGIRRVERYGIPVVCVWLDAVICYTWKTVQIWILEFVIFVYWKQCLLKRFWNWSVKTNEILFVGAELLMCYSAYHISFLVLVWRFIERLVYEFYWLCCTDFISLVKYWYGIFLMRALQYMLLAFWWGMFYTRTYQCHMDGVFPGRLIIWYMWLRSNVILHPVYAGFWFPSMDVF